MNIAISNIAWDHHEDDKAAKILKKYKLTGLEIAPSKIWDDPTSVSNEMIQNYKTYWNEKGISIIASQSLLYGHPELTIFESKYKRGKTLIYLHKIIKLLSILGIQNVIFGSPKNRVRGKMSKKEAILISKDFFTKISDYCRMFGMFFCIEANPELYGSDFINTTDEVIELVKYIDHPNFRVHLDTGAMVINNENYEVVVEKAFPYLKHVHISERNIGLLSQGNVDHKKLAKLLKKFGYNRWISIEMKNKLMPSNIDAIEEALDIVSRYYYV